VSKPKMPKRIVLAGRRFRVRRDGAVLDRASVKMGGELSGFSNYGDQVIAVRRGQPHDFDAEVLLHEILHMCLSTSGCDPDKDAAANLPDVEERAVVAMAAPLLAVLRDNPDLVEFLTA